jgi:hypothetical protein
MGKRLFDVTCFIIAVVCLATAVTVGFCAEQSEQALVIGLGICASIIGVILDYRQKTVYERDHIEISLLSNGLQVKYLNAVARLRHKLVASNILIVTVGIWVSGYGAVWNTP